MRKCSKCSSWKAEMEFSRYKKRNGAHGYRGHCKVCDSEYKRAHYLNDQDSYKERAKAKRDADLEGMREYSRKHYRANRERIRESQKRYLSSERGRQLALEASRRYRRTEEGKLKESARGMLNKAIAGGRVRKPSRCSECGTKGYVEGHHDDYRKPLEVRWLCRQCHENMHHLNGGHESIQVTANKPGGKGS